MKSEAPRVAWVRTDDGTRTLRNLDLDVTYRSSGGAALESKVIYVDGTWTLGPTRRVLELGFGAARNFAETAMHARRLGYSLHYFSVDHAFIEPGWVEAGPFSDHVKEALVRVKSEGRAEVSWGTSSLVLVAAEWGSAESAPPWRAHSVYHDPFGPAVNAAAWTREAFEWSYQHLEAGGILGTYGAATATRRAMVEAGFYIARMKGPGRKREITFASRTPEPLSDRGATLIPRSKYVDF